MIDRQGGPTPRDDQKKMVSDVLKRVDMLIRQGDLSQAHAETQRAKEIDPKNVYAVAFEERIASLLEKQASDKAASQARAAEPPPAPSKPQFSPPPKEPSAPPPAPVAPKPVAAETPKPAPPPPAKPPAPSRPVPPAPGATPAIPRSTDPPPDPSGPDLFQKLKNKMDAYHDYKKALLEVWSDGAANEKETEWLNVLRGTLGISDQDHERLQHEVQLEAYLETLKSAWTKGKIRPENASLLAEMRKTFNISQADHDKIESRFLAELQAIEKKTAKIVVVDDEQKLLDLICDTLVEAGFATLPFTTSDEAYAYLKGGSVPDLILCDVNLETSTMGGFSFYEKIQWLDHLVDVPFIFLTGLTDEVLIRTGKELGVDDYLTKPISDQTLVATIKGKLKRFKRIQQRK